jgi:UDP-N-acetylmuramoyl-L-alanyl-D-glutamate--2,6-diaminopimelate ligase
VRLHDLLAASRAEALDTFEVRGESDTDVTTIVHDHRDAAPGALFCCIPGEHVDGHEFAAAAVQGGASACLVERRLPIAATQVRVDSVRHAIGPLCATFYGWPSRAMKVLGITGTNGKTTTTYLLEAIAREAGERVGVVGTTGARLDGAEVALRHTTPEATELQALLARMRDDGAGVVAMEVSSHALEQHRVDGTRFAAACFTNLTHDHLDYHGTIDAYFRAKARLFTSEFTDRAAISVDDEHGRELVGMARANGVSVMAYALDGEGDVSAHEVEQRLDGTTFALQIGSEVATVATSLVGRFNVLNCLAAATAATLCEVSFDAIAAGLSAPVVVPGRMERVEGPGRPFSVLVDYAHTPDALARVLDASRAMTRDDGHLIVVFGCGGDRDRSKRPAMGHVVASRAEVAVLTSDNPRSEDPAAIAADVLTGIADDDRRPIVELDRRAAIRLALAAAKPGDVVVIAGKGHETGQTAGGVTTPFDDRVVAREELAARV